MSGYVVDASVAVKWLVNDSFSEEAASLLNDEVTLIAPELLFVEVSNALWTVCGRDDISKMDFAEAVDVLRAAPVTVPVSMRQLAASAGRLAVDLDHPVHDCDYLALAVQEQQYAVVTADRRFHRTVSKHPYLSDKITLVENLPAGSGG